MKKKVFDCVEMKRRIQEQIYEETKNMSHEELLAYFHRRIANSRFASFLDQSAESQHQKATQRAA
jgi:predicted ATPase